jgi:hypothetical protein
VRISHQLGIGGALTSKIGQGEYAAEPYFKENVTLIGGQDFGTLYFHHKSFVNSPFMNFDVAPDWQEQSVPGAISQFQPNFGT